MLLAPPPYPPPFAHNSQHIRPVIHDKSHISAKSVFACGMGVCVCAKVSFDDGSVIRQAMERRVCEYELII